MSNTVEHQDDCPAAKTDAASAVSLDIRKLVDRARQIRSTYADEDDERTRLDVTARCFLVHVTSAIFQQLGEGTHDEVVRALGFDHLARDTNRSRRNPAACAELMG